MSHAQKHRGPTHLITRALGGTWASLLLLLLIMLRYNTWTAVHQLISVLQRHSGFPGISTGCSGLAGGEGREGEREGDRTQLVESMCV